MRVKAIQLNGKNVPIAYEGQEVAISIPGINFERQMKNVKYLYSDITEKEFKHLVKNKDLLRSKQLNVLVEIGNFKGWL